jgi:hypothetical protein
MGKEGGREPLSRGFGGIHRWETEGREAGGSGADEGRMAPRSLGFHPNFQTLREGEIGTGFFTRGVPFVCFVSIVRTDTGELENLMIVTLLGSSPAPNLFE